MAEISTRSQIVGSVSQIEQSGVWINLQSLPHGSNNQTSLTPGTRWSTMGGGRDSRESGHCWCWFFALKNWFISDLNEKKRLSTLPRLSQRTAEWLTASPYSASSSDKNYWNSLWNGPLALITLTVLTTTSITSPSWMVFAQRASWWMIQWNLKLQKMVYFRSQPWNRK